MILPTASSAWFVRIVLDSAKLVKVRTVKKRPNARNPSPGKP